MLGVALAAFCSERACRAVSDVCLRFLHLSAGFLGTGVVCITGVPGSFGRFLCFCGIGFDGAPPVCSILFGHERVCRAVSDVYVRFLHLSAGFLATGVTGVTGMPGSFGLRFGFYGIG